MYELQQFVEAPPTFKGPKLVGQINNHKSFNHHLIFGFQPFAVDYSLKCGIPRHHQVLGLIPAAALPGL